MGSVADRRATTRVPPQGFHGPGFAVDDMVTMDREGIPLQMPATGCAMLEPSDTSLQASLVLIGELRGYECCRLHRALGRDPALRARLRFSGPGDARRLRQIFRQHDLRREVKILPPLILLCLCFSRPRPGGSCACLSEQDRRALDPATLFRGVRGGASRSRCNF